MQLLCMLYLRRLLMPMSVTSKYEFGMKSTREIVSNAFVAVSKQNNVIKQTKNVFLSLSLSTFACFLFFFFFFFFFAFFFLFSSTLF